MYLTLIPCLHVHITPTQPTHITFKQHKYTTYTHRYQSLLSEVEDGMRSVLVTADDYDR